MDAFTTVLTVPDNVDVPSNEETNGRGNYAYCVIAWGCLLRCVFFTYPEQYVFYFESQLYCHSRPRLVIGIIFGCFETCFRHPSSYSWFISRFVFLVSHKLTLGDNLKFPPIFFVNTSFFSLYHWRITEGIIIQIVNFRKLMHVVMKELIRSRGCI